MYFYYDYRGNKHIAGQENGMLLNYKNTYEKNIVQKLNEADPSPDIELEWDNLKNIIYVVAYNEVGTRINIKNAGWFDEDCRKAIKAKNEARKKCVSQDTRTNREEYQYKKKK